MSQISLKIDIVKLGTTKTMLVRMGPAPLLTPRARC